ncbi:hypothetical protein L873DRAFT_1848354 [Choiromyces venosus 120613-1]|uniref:ABM domain-containing protein n=1 Tax=Choiromyces venosus 120613-1 TaxID=1336337 RepID=A0A3N4J460_9PEZI|nr:hypothetical protein L873DRAFT_1848354 [Choiromyces venosus 120613-1]
MGFPKNAIIITTSNTSTEAAIQQLLTTTPLPTTTIFSATTIDENTPTLRTIGICPSESPITAGDGATKHTVSTYYAGYNRRPNQSWPAKPFVLWADLHMKREHLHLLPRAAEVLIEAVVRDEPGVLCYLWLQDVDDERHVTVFECYVDRDACKAHEATEAYSRFAEAVGPYAESLVINYAEWKDGTLV